jgi:hypothetical protein
VLPAQAQRPVRIAIVLAVLSVSCLVLTSCGSNTGSAGQSTSTTLAYRDPPIRSYLQESANYVYLMQLDVGRVSGIFEEDLGPAITPDHRVHDWVYRVSGTLSGQNMTYRLTSITQGAPAFPQTMMAILAARSLTLKAPFSDGAGDVLGKSNQMLYDLAARAHVKAWTASSGPAGSGTDSSG